MKKENKLNKIQVSIRKLFGSFFKEPKKRLKKKKENLVSNIHILN
jgi:hypothetical protein